MKKLFYIGIVGGILFEVANVYFIMPMPGSQKAETIDLAYFLYTWRWVFRVLYGLCVIIGFRSAFQSHRIISTLSILLLGGVIYMFNFKMTAERMFEQPQELILATSVDNTIPDHKLVLGYVDNEEARAYPIQLIAYHHQVLDTIGDQPIMVTYCSVCRSGRIFKPEIDGELVSFRLVGMDHFNAMFEDNHTRSWWRQATGEAITGKLKGAMLPELLSEQMTLAQWLELYPHSLVMQYDTMFQAAYDSLDTYDKGLGRGKLTGTDTLSWNDKSWVVGVVIKDESKAYDWNHLRKTHIIHDVLNSTPIVIALASDTMSFVVYERPSPEMMFTILDDTLRHLEHKYDLAGKAAFPGGTSLKPVYAYQEFWHSWKEFHPETKKHE